MIPFKSLPFPGLKTERLHLRQLKPENEKQLFELRNNERVLEFIERPKANSMEDVRDFMNEINQGIADNKWLYWGISIKNDPKLIGTICLWNFNEKIAEAEIGYELHPNYQGKGIMQEAVGKIIHFGFEILKLESIRAFTHPKNNKSSKLLEKMGFVFQKQSDSFSIFILPKPYLLEACVDSLDKAILAQKNAADRVELCARLEVGGLSPSRKLIESVQAALSIPIMAMVRPRPGNFVYSRKELALMAEEIRFCKESGLAGVVFGTLTDTAAIHLEQTRYLAAVAHPLQVTFHKAIDAVLDPLEEIEKLMAVPQIQRVLTSGKATTALEGKDLIKKMIAVAGDQLTILACGKVTKENLFSVHQQIGAKEYHGRKIVSE